MVKHIKFWDQELDKAIARTKIRIKFCEKHGIGNTTIKEKAILVLQQRQLELRATK